MRENGILSIQLCYFGRVDPAIYGIDYVVPASYLEPVDPAGRLKPGYLAVGVSLYGRGYYVYDHGAVRFMPGPLRLDPKVVGAPVAIVGNVFQIFAIR